MSHQMSGSPDSSDPMESPHATPATKVSIFSPESTRLSSASSVRGIVRPRIPPPFDLQFSSLKEQPDQGSKDVTIATPNDPFVSASPLTSSTNHSSSDPSKLSPAAAAFTPASILDSPAGADHLHARNAGSTLRQIQNTVTNSHAQAEVTTVSFCAFQG